jgi:hypothetical protein
MTLRTMDDVRSAQLARMTPAERAEFHEVYATARLALQFGEQVQTALLSGRTRPGWTEDPVDWAAWSVLEEAAWTHPSTFFAKVRAAGSNLVVRSMLVPGHGRS